MAEYEVKTLNITKGSDTYHINLDSSASGTITVTGTITNTSGQYSGTFQDARISTGMKCLVLEVSNPEIFLSGNVSVVSGNGSITITSDSVAGTSTFTATFIASILNSTEYTSLFNLKANKVSGATSGNIAALDENGDLVDSGKTLGKSVPSDAVFTDTTYDNATQSADGLMSSTDKTKLDGVQAGAQVNPGNATQSASGLMSAEDKSNLDGVLSALNKIGLTLYNNQLYIQPVTSL